MRKVFVINQSSHDYSVAEQFGELVFMTKGSVNRFNVSEIFRLLDPFLSQSSENDYLLVGGHSVLCSVACSMFVAKHKRLNLLIYKAIPLKAGSYKERIIIF